MAKSLTVQNIIDAVDESVGAKSDSYMLRLINDALLDIGEKKQHYTKEVTTDLASGTRRQPRLTVPGIDGRPRPVSIDDGLIIGLKGTMSRIVGIMGGRAPMSMEEVDAFIDANPDEQIPTFQEWQFRIAYVKKTNGPEARANMLKSEDKKRTESQSDMFKAFAEMFRMGMAHQGGQEISPDAQAMLNMGIEKAVGCKKGT